MIVAEEYKQYLLDNDIPLPPDPLDTPAGFELIDGELVGMKEMGYESSWIVSELFFHIRTYLAQNRIGVAATTEASYACFPNSPKQVRKPDIAVLLCDPAVFVPPRVNCRQVPELIIEVVSSNDTFVELHTKLGEFFRAGTRLVWVVNPDIRTVYVHYPDRTIQTLIEPADLTCENLLPGFRVPLAAFLPPLPAVPTA